MRRVLTTLLWTLSVYASASAQVVGSSIVGQVVDASGAVVPGVSVVAVRVDTDFRYETVTTEEGYYRIQDLQPGIHRVTFELSGFKRVIREPVTLRAGETARLDATLELGGLTDEVEVVATQLLLQTETSDTGSVLAGEQVATLPMYQRQANATLLLVPGASTRGYAAGGLGSYSVAGQRPSGTAAFIDGMPANDPVGGLTTPRVVQNSISDLKIYTGTLPAEFGHTTGGVVSVVKKTGTNKLEGLVSYFGREGRMQHRNFFDRDRPKEVHFMQPEIYLGGPVMIPGVYNGHSKTFFFFSYERLLDKQTKEFFGSVPTEEMKAGNFSFGGIGNQLYDPATTRQLPDGTWTRDPFPGNVIPVNRIDPVAAKVLAVNPWLLPNLPGQITREGPSNNLLYARPAKANWNDYSVRIDHQFSPAFTMYGSYNVNESGGTGRPEGGRWGQGDGPLMSNGADVRAFYAAGRQLESLNQTVTVANTWLINSTTVSSTRVGYDRRASESIPFSYQQDYSGFLGIPNVSGEMLPAFGSGAQFSPASAYGISPTGPSDDLGQTYFIQTDVTKATGAHSIKAGYEYLRFNHTSRASNIPSGNFFFDSMTSGLLANGNPVPNTGNSFAGFLLGYVRQAQFDEELAPWKPRSSINSLYIQDDWRVTSELTLNLGLRYSNETPYQADNQSNFDPTAIDDLTGRVGAIIHPDGALNKRDNNNFQPRVGLAWHPLERWAFRTGFGVNTMDVRFPLRRGNFDEYVAQANLQRAPGDPRPLFTLSQGPPTFNYNIRPDGTSPFLGVNYSARNVEWWDPDLHNPTVYNWNASVQYQLGQHYLIELMYQGSKGVDLIERWEINTFPVDFGKDDPALREAAFRAPQNFRPFPHMGNIRFRSNFGRSEYHGGTIKFEKRYSHGLSFLSHYTLSKAMNSQDDENSGSGVQPLTNRDLEWALAGHHRKHSFMTSVVYQLPFGDGRRFLSNGGLWSALLGNFTVSGIQAFQSGNPVTFSFAGSPNNYFPAFVGDRRPDIVTMPEMVDDWREFYSNRFDPAAMAPVVLLSNFAYPAAFTAGNAGRNNMIGPPLIWTTLSAQKDIPVGDSYRLQLRVDFNNPFKTWNFNPPNTVVNFQTPQTFGKITSTPETAGFGGAPLWNAAVKFYF